MAIIKSSVKLILKEYPRYKYEGPVLALGTAEIYATYPELSEWFRALAGSECRVSADEVKLSENPVGSKLGWVDADTFFRAFGFSDVTSVDLPGAEHEPDLYHDFNNPLPSDYVNRFNLIIDPGTMEHVFNIKTGFSNVVWALRVGGVVIQQLPIYSFNGGYYSINPNVLNDFYAANGFSDLRSYIIMWDRYHAHTGASLCYEYSEATLGQRHALSDHDQCRYSPHLLFMARKVKEQPEIVTPIQFEGDYVAGLEGPQSQNGDTRSFWRRLRSKARSAVYRGLPYSVSYSLLARLAREKKLSETRRHSFWI